MQCNACTKAVGGLKSIFGKDAHLRDAYIMKFNNNGIRRRKFIALCHGLTGADLYGTAMSVIFEKNAIRPGSVKRRITFVELHELRARLTNDPARLQRTIADGPAFTDRGTGYDMYPLLKEEHTPSYIDRLAIPRGITRPPMLFRQRGLTRTAMLNPQGEVKAALPDTARAGWWGSGPEQPKRGPYYCREGSGRSGHCKEAAPNASKATYEETTCGEAETNISERRRNMFEAGSVSQPVH